MEGNQTHGAHGHRTHQLRGRHARPHNFANHSLKHDSMDKTASQNLLAAHLQKGHSENEHYDSDELIGVEHGDEDIFENYSLAKLGINLNYWLFTGLIMHEFAHYLGCILAGSRVHEVVWW